MSDNAKNSVEQYKYGSAELGKDPSDGTWFSHCMQHLSISESLNSSVVDLMSLDAVRDKTIYILAGLQQGSNLNRIGYVSGIITSDGPDYVQKNMRDLREYSRIINRLYGVPVFSAADIFSEQLLINLSADIIPQEDWHRFWRSILKCGFITDIFMTPHWRRSRGAIDEHDMSRELGLLIHYI